MKAYDCNDLPTIHWWTNKKKIITAVDGCRWQPHYLLYPPGLRSARAAPGFWAWVPVNGNYMR